MDIATVAPLLRNDGLFIFCTFGNKLLYLHCIKNQIAYDIKLRIKIRIP